MPKYKPRQPGPDGWSEWEPPIQNFKMACCDCGLVHELQFKVLKVTKRDGKDFEANELEWGKYRIAFRARRNNRATGQIRRHRKD